MKLRNGTMATALACMASLLSLSWYTAWQNGKEKLIAYQREFHALKERLRIAEHRTLQRSSELNTLLRQFKEAVAEANGSKDSLSSFSDKTLKLLNELRSTKTLEVPNIYYLLPHLLRNGTSLQPSVQVGLGRTGVSIVMGIPTVKRKVKSYLIDTLQSLIYKLSPEEKQDCVMIVFIGETDPDYVNNVVERLEKQFSTEISSGLVEIIAPPAFYYPDMENLKQTFGDSKERVRWRTKQNLDYCFLMMYAQKKGEYYVQLEDDIVANHNYFSRMKNFALQLPSEDWMILEFSQLGFIGKMFKSADVTLIVEFILMFYKEKPIDWLLDHILWVKACHPEKDAKHCDRQKSSIRIRFRPSLFQHEGVHSSLDGKIQNLKDKFFLKAPLYEVHVNPPAEVSTTLRVYDGHSLEKAYTGEDFFWAVSPSANDYILFKFDNPVNIERYLIRTGNVNHPDDLLFNTSVEVLPSKNEDLKLSQETKEKQLEDGYFRIGKFENGIAEGKVDPSLNPIVAVRLFVIQTSALWAIISEIHIKKASQSISWKKQKQKRYS